MKNLRDPRAAPVVVRLSGDRARRLADRLLAPRAPGDRLWEEVGALGRGHRIAHDWDPATGRLTLAMQG